MDVFTISVCLVGNQNLWAVYICDACKRKSSVQSCCWTWVVNTEVSIWNWYHQKLWQYSNLNWTRVGLRLYFCSVKKIIIIIIIIIIINIIIIIINIIIIIVIIAEFATVC